MRRLFVSSLAVALVAVLLLSLEIAQLHVLAYMQYAIMASFLLGLFLGLKKEVREKETARMQTATWRWRRFPALSYMALLLWLLVTVRLANLSDLGLIPDASTIFEGIRFLEPSIFQETVATAILATLLQLNLMIFRSLAVQLFRPAKDSTVAGTIGISLLGTMPGVLLGWLIIAAATLILPRGQDSALPSESNSSIEAATLAIVPHPRNTLLLNCTAAPIPPASPDSASQPGISIHMVTAGVREFLTRDKATYDLIVLADKMGSQCISPFALTRRDDCYSTPDIFELIKSKLGPNGYLIVISANPRNWHFLRLVRNAQESFGLADGFARLSTGAQLFAVSPSHPRDLQTVLAAVSGVTAAPDTISINEKARTALVGSDDWPYSFLEFRTVPLPYLWCLYLIAGILMFNGGTSDHSRFNMRAARWFLLGLGSGAVFVWSMMRLSVLTGDISGAATQAILGAVGLAALGTAAVGRNLAAPRLITWLLVFLDIGINLWLSQSVQSTFVIILLIALLLFTLAVAIVLEATLDPQFADIKVALAGLSVALLLQNLTFICGISSVLISAGAVIAMSILVSRFLSTGTEQMPSVEVH